MLLGLETHYAVIVRYEGQCDLWSVCFTNNCFSLNSREFNNDSGHNYEVNQNLQTGGEM